MSIRFIPFLLASVWLTASCTPQANTVTSKPLVSATINWIGYAGHYVAASKKIFAQEKLNVQDLVFQSSTEEITAFLAKKVDIGWFTSGDAIEILAKDPTVKVIYLVDSSNGSDGILGRNIKSPKDLKGKTVARENVIFEKIILQNYLRKGGLSEKDVIIKNMSAPDAATAFAAQKVDAAVTYEPYLSKSATQGKGKVIFSTKNTNLITDVVLVRDSLLKTRKDDLQAYFRAIDKGVKLVKAKDSEALKITGSKLGISPKEVQEQLTGVKIFDLNDNKTVAFNKSNPNSVIANLATTAKAAAEFKVVSKPLKVESLYDDSIVKSTSVQ